MSFVSDEMLHKLDNLTEKEANELPFGVVRVDDEGIVNLYNQYESEISKLPSNEVVGKNFFLTVAPCTNNRLFKGKFDTGVNNNSLDLEFLYTFTYCLRPTNVAIRLYRHSESKTNWIFTQRR
jgi:photoactive yellow protein